MSRHKPPGEYSVLTGLREERKFMFSVNFSPLLRACVSTSDLGICLAIKKMKQDTNLAPCRLQPEPSLLLERMHKPCLLQAGYTTSSSLPSSSPSSPFWEGAHASELKPIPIPLPCHGRYRWSVCLILCAHSIYTQ